MSFSAGLRRCRRSCHLSSASSHTLESHQSTCLGSTCYNCKPKAAYSVLPNNIADPTTNECALVAAIAAAWLSFTVGWARLGGAALGLGLTGLGIAWVWLVLLR